MPEMKISRRQFVGGAAAAAAATALPLAAGVSTAAAVPDVRFPLPTPTVAGGWTPLDPKAAARLGWEIHAGLHTAATGQKS